GLLAFVLAVVAGVGVWIGSWGPGDGDRAAAAGTEGGQAAPPAAGTGESSGDDAASRTEEASQTAEPEPEPEKDPVWQKDPVPNARPSDTTAVEPVDYLTGGMTPKSIMASGHGLMIANNMMYSHSSTVFDSTTREQVAVLDDAVDLAEFGVEGHPGI